MNPLIRSLFHELLDLPVHEREKALAGRQIPADIRAELESLLNHDSEHSSALTANVSQSAENVLASGDNSDGTSWGPYRRIRVLGSGGMGSVYLAERTDGEIQQQVAVKLLRADTERPVWRERFLKERQLLAYLNHPSIVHLIDAGHTNDNRPYLVMEYVEGVPIDVYTAGMELRDQLKLFLLVCDGVSHAHRHLIVHRDLKPSNILVATSGQPKILDFGIAKLLDGKQSPTKTVERLLTPHYASPEQFLGIAQTTATDVYSLAAVLYRILVGRSPHESEAGELQAMDMISSGRHVPSPRRLRPNLPSDVDFILRKALRIEPEERYISVEAFANDLRAFLEWRPVQARSGDAWYRTRKFIRRYWVPVAAAALLVFVLSLGLAEVAHERTIAQRRFDQVRQLANRVLALDDVLKGLPGSTKVRSEIVAISKDYLEGLSAEARNDKQLAFELGNAFSTLAQVQGVPGYLNLGQYAQATESLGKANQLMSVVLASEPKNPKALVASAEINEYLMILADADHQDDVVLAQARIAADLVESFLRTEDLAASDNRRAGTVLLNVALAHKNLNLYADSVHYGRRSLEVYRTVPSAEALRANVLSIVADALRLSGDLDGAFQSIQEAEKTFETATFTGENSRIFALFNVFWREGLILGEDDEINLGRTDDAIVVLQRAYDLIEEGATADANDASTRILFASAGRELGNVVRHRDPERSLQIYDHAIQRLQEIRNNNKALRGEAQLMACSSFALLTLKRPEEARKRIDRAIQLLRQTKNYPAKVIQPSDEIATVLSARAAYQAAIGETQDALHSYQELLDAILASHPDPQNDLRHATNLSHLYASIEALEARAGRKDEAAAVLDTRRKIWQGWVLKLGPNDFIQRQLASASLQTENR